MATKKTTTKPKQLSCKELQTWMEKVYKPWYKKAVNVSTNSDSGGNPTPPPPPPPGGGH
jgi:hypothetical protein